MTARWGDAPDRFGARRAHPAMDVIAALLEQFAAAVLESESSGPSASASSATADRTHNQPRPVHPHPGEATTKEAHR